MASYTGNLGLKKPALDDDALITDINNNMDIVDAAINGIQDGLAIVANNNTHVAITAGQFVYVRNHSTLTEGLYVASTNIAANATLSTSNLTADAAGGLNLLNSNITNLVVDTTIDVGSSTTKLQSFETTNSGWFNPPTGYTPISVWYEQLGGGLNFNCFVVKGTNQQFMVIITNVYSTEITLHGRVHVICRKNV